MKSSKLSYVIIIVLALIVAFLSYSYLSTTKTTIFIFNDDYPAGHVIVEDMLTPIQVDANMVVEAFNEEVRYAIPGNLDEILGQYLRFDVVKGTPLMSIHADEQGGARTEKRLNANMVAFTVPVDNITGGSPFIEPESFVNVYVSYDNDFEETSELKYQNVRVIDVLYAETYSETSDSPTLSGVTLEIKPEQSVELMHAVEFGRVRIALIKSNHYEEVQVEPYTTGSIPNN